MTIWASIAWLITEEGPVTGSGSSRRVSLITTSTEVVFRSLTSLGILLTFTNTFGFQFWNGKSVSLSDRMILFQTFQRDCVKKVEIFGGIGWIGPETDSLAYAQSKFYSLVLVVIKGSMY